jgi:hypothetical protein
LHLLLRNSKNNGFADLGGKKEKIDKSPSETACREAFEESNGVFDKEYLKGKIGDCK